VLARSWPLIRDTLRGMQDKDPRPMPIEVQSAYREPIDLLGLLETDAYSMADRIAVRDALLSSLLARYGDAWVEVGSKEVRVTTRVKAFRKNVAAGIKLLLDVPDYGGRKETLPLLAQAMEPKWAEWWDSFELTDVSTLNAWTRATQHVLGPRQFAWLAAQYTRSVIELGLPQDRDVCLRAIKAVEAWSRVPDVQNRQVAIDAGGDAARALNAPTRALRGTTRATRAAANAGYALRAANAATSVPNAAAYYATSVPNAAANAGYALRAANAAANAAFNAAFAIDTAYFVANNDAWRRLAVLTRRLITPTLVTGAVLGARTNPQRKASAKVARLEREVRSAADGRALSISGLHVGRALLVRMSPPLRGAEWVIVSHIRVHGEDEFAFFISDRAGTWPRRMLELYVARKVSDFKQALAQIDYELVGG
jgi:hypothetical protein